KVKFEYDVSNRDEIVTIASGFGFAGSFLRDRSFLRGQLLNEYYFRTDDNNNPVKHVQYNYDPAITLPQKVVGLKVGTGYDAQLVDQYSVGASPYITCGAGDGEPCDPGCPCGYSDIYSSRRQYTVLRVYEE